MTVPKETINVARTGQDKTVKTRKSISSARLFKTVKAFVDAHHELTVDSQIEELFEVLADQIVEDAIR